jgi:parallel beta-helix repeat protein
MRRMVLIVAVLGLATQLSMSIETQQPSCTAIIQPGESIQAAIDTVEEGAVICLAEGTWRENIIIRRSLTLRGKGANQSSIKGQLEGKPVIQIEGNLEVRIEELTIAEAKLKGAWGTLEEQGIRIMGQARVTILDSIIERNGWYGILAGDSAQVTIYNSICRENFYGIGVGKRARVTISNSTVEKNGVDGIILTGSAQVTLSGSTIVKENRFGIYIQGVALAQVIISDSTVVENRGYGIFITGSAKATISSLTVERNLWDGISIVGFVRATISNVTVAENERHGITIGGLAQATLTNLIIQENHRSGISIGDSAQVTIEKNKVMNNGQYGVAIYQEPCYYTDEEFEGAVYGKMNEISGNKEGQLCPLPGLEFLITTAGGCYGPKC